MSEAVRAVLPRTSCSQRYFPKMALIPGATRVKKEGDFELKGEAHHTGGCQELPEKKPGVIHQNFPHGEGTKPGEILCHAVLISHGRVGAFNGELVDFGPARPEGSQYLALRVTGGEIQVSPPSICDPQGFQIIDGFMEHGPQFGGGSQALKLDTHAFLRGFLS